MGSKSVFFFWLFNIPHHSPVLPKTGTETSYFTNRNWPEKGEVTRQTGGIGEASGGEKEGEKTRKKLSTKCPTRHVPLPAGGAGGLKDASRSPPAPHVLSVLSR